MKLCLLLNWNIIHFKSDMNYVLHNVLNLNSKRVVLKLLHDHLYSIRFYNKVPLNFVHRV